MYESLFLTSIEDVALISAYVSIAFIVGFLQRYSSIFKYLFSILNIGAVYYFFFYEPEKLNLEIFIPLILFALIHWLLLWQVNKMKVESYFDNTEGKQHGSNNESFVEIRSIR